MELLEINCMLMCREETTHSRVNFVTTFTDMSDLKVLNDIHAVHLTAVLCLASCLHIYV